MKTHRIYGMQNGKMFHHFPQGENVMKNIKITVYHKKKVQIYYGKDFKLASINTWSFTLGDLLCYVYMKKNNTFKVYDDNCEIFYNNQIAGIYFLQESFLPELTPQEKLRVNTDDERIRLGDLKEPPFRAADHALLESLHKNTFFSPTTKMSEQSRCIQEILCDEPMKDYEVNARNEIITSNYNSWSNRFGEDIIRKAYIYSEDFFKMLFKAIDIYFFGYILKEIAVWRFSFEKISIAIDPRKTKTPVVGIKLKKKSIQDKPIDKIIHTFQLDLVHVLCDVLGMRKRKNIIESLFNATYEKRSSMFHYKIRHVPGIHYQELHHKCPGPLMLE